MSEKLRSKVSQPKTLLSFILVVCLAPAIQNRAETKWNTSVGSLPVVISATARSPKCSAKPAIVLEKITLKSQASIDALLKSRRLAANNDTYSLIYELNSDLVSLDRLRPGRVIVMPKIVSGCRGIEFSLELDPALRAVVVSLRDQVEIALKYASDLDASAVGSEQAQSELLQSLNQIRDTVGDFGIVVRDSDLPLSHSILRQLVAETSYISSVFSAAPNQISDDQRLRILQIRDDMILKRSNLNERRDLAGRPMRWLDTLVKVNTFRAQGTREPVSNLRVCWVPEALFGIQEAEHPFPRVSSPTEEVLPEADYLFWAAKDNGSLSQQCVDRISTPLQVTVRKRSPPGVEVDIVVNGNH
jgi:hypothetical protein